MNAVVTIHRRSPRLKTWRAGEDTDWERVSNDSTRQGCTMIDGLADAGGMRRNGRLYQVDGMFRSRVVWDVMASVVGVQVFQLPVARHRCRLA